VWWNVEKALHSKFLAESVSKEFLKSVINFDKVAAKSLVASSFGTQCRAFVHGMYTVIVLM